MDTDLAPEEIVSTPLFVPMSTTRVLLVEPSFERTTTCTLDFFNMEVFAAFSTESVVGLFVAAPAASGSDAATMIEPRVKDM